MKHKFIIFSLFLALGLMSLINPQTKQITEKFFPDFDIKINTPAFQKNKGFTKYLELIQYLEKYTAEHSDLMSLSYIGESQKGKKIPMVKIQNNKGADKVKVWIQGGLHGDEPASTEGVLYLIDRLLTDEKYSYLLEKLDLCLVPMANIDGYEKQNRYAANGLDLNRDQTKLMAKESVILKQAFSDFGAEVALDFHEYRPYRKDFAQLSTFGITSRFDVMFLYSGNLNVPENLRKFTREIFVSSAEKTLLNHGLSTHDYITTDKYLGDIQFNQGSISARSSATNYALTNCISTLVEVRGVGIGRTSLNRRVYSTFLVATDYLKTAYENSAQLKNVIAEAIKNNGIGVVTSKRAISIQPLKVIDLETNEEIELNVTVHDALKASPVITRIRPTAYILESPSDAVIQKLNALGMVLNKLSSEQSIEVQSYTVDEYKQESSKYEGVKLQHVQCTNNTKTKTFAPGTYVLYMDQPRANLAIEVLEPEASNSFISFDVIRTKKGEELSIYRYLKAKKLEP